MHHYLRYENNHRYDNREDRIAKEVDALDAENDAPYSKEVFALWDNSLNTQVQSTTVR